MATIYRLGKIEMDAGLATVVAALITTAGAIWVAHITTRHKQRDDRSGEPYKVASPMIQNQVPGQLQEPTKRQVIVKWGPVLFSGATGIMMLGFGVLWRHESDAVPVLSYVLIASLQIGLAIIISFIPARRF